MRWKSLLLIAFAILVVAACYYFWPKSVSFPDIHDARAAVEEAGYHCIADRADGKVNNGFFVTRRPLAWEDANEMWKAGLLGEEWKGRVWVTRNSANLPLATSHDDVAPRIWGNVLALGDPELLDELETTLQNPPVGTM